MLLAGVNDRDEDAHRLVKLLKGLRCKVNLIPFNEFPGSPFCRPTDHSVLAFQTILTHVLGACGQLGNLSPEYAGRALTQIESRC